MPRVEHPIQAEMAKTPQYRLMAVIEENIGAPEGWLEKTYCAV